MCSIMYLYMYIKIKIRKIYRNASNKRPGRLLNFCEFKGVCIRGGRLKEGGVY